MHKLDVIRPIGVVTYSEEEGYLLNGEKSEKEKNTEEILFFDLQVEATKWKQALGMHYKKKGHYLVEPSNFDVEAGNWLGEFAKKNRLDVSLRSSCRYEAWAARIKEWAMTGFLEAQGEIEIECASRQEGWKWLDLLYWWFGIELNSWERGGRELVNLQSSIKIQLKQGEQNSLRIMQPKREVTWNGIEGLRVRDASGERSIYLPKAAKSVEQACRVHELVHDGKWIVFPCVDCLMWLKNGEWFNCFSQDC